MRIQVLSMNSEENVIAGFKADIRIKGVDWVNNVSQRPAGSGTAKHSQRVERASLGGVACSGSAIVGPRIPSINE